MTVCSGYNRRACNSTSHSTLTSNHTGMKLPKLVTNSSRLSLSLVRVTLAHSSQVVSDITEQVNLLIYVREVLPFIIISESRKKQTYCAPCREIVLTSSSTLLIGASIYIYIYIYMPVIIATNRRTTPVKLKTHSDARRWPREDIIIESQAIALRE